MFSEDHNQTIFRAILLKDLEEYALMFDANEKLAPPFNNNNNSTNGADNKILANKLKLQLNKASVISNKLLLPQPPRF